MQHLKLVRVLVIAAFASCILSTRAATVPAGAVLAAKQVLLRGNGLEPESLDPAHARGDAAGNVLRDLFEGLTTESPDGKVIPGVADHWKISAHGRVYTFHIRNDARWSNGTPVTAQDFVFSLRRMLDPATASNYANVYAPIKNALAVNTGKLPPKKLGVEALDKHNLRITLSSPTPYFLGLLYLPPAFPVYRPAVEKYGREFTRPGHMVSNGAYRLEKWVVNSRIVLSRDPYYWNNTRTVINKVIYYPVSDENAELNLFRAGQLDITYTIPVAQFSWIKTHLGKELHIAPFLSTYFYGFNLRRPPFRNARALRQALSMSIDREVIAGKVLGLGEIPAYGLVPPGVANYTPQDYAWTSWPRQKRLAEARKLYREAGYTNMRPLTVELRYNSGAIHQRIAQAIAAMWKANLGVHTVLINEEWKVLLQDREEGKVTQIYRDGWGGDYNDANTFLDLFTSHNPINDTGYANAQYTRLVDAAAAETDVEKRRVILEKAEKILLRDSPIMPIYYYVSKHLIKPYIGGWHDNTVDHHYTRDLYILKH